MALFRPFLSILVVLALLLMGTALTAALSASGGSGSDNKPIDLNDVDAGSPSPASVRSSEPTPVDSVESEATALPVSATGAQPAPARPITIAIDPGHGGPDAGASHHNAAGLVDLIEKNANLAIALRLAELLRADGYQVVLTRDSDKAVNDPPQDWTGDGQVNSRDELQARVDIANAAGASVFVSIHNNGSTSPAQSGTEVWWSPDRPFADDNAFLAERTQAALLKRLVEAGYQSVDRGIKSDHAFRIWQGRAYNLFVLGPVTGERHPRATEMPGILGETLFVSNDTEAYLLQQPYIIDAIASGYRDGIVAFLAR